MNLALTSPSTSDQLHDSRRIVSDLMIRSIHTIQRTARVLTARALMRAHHTPYLFVLSGHEIEGLILERDINEVAWFLNAVSDKSVKPAMALTVEDLMRTPIPRLSAETSVARAIALTRERHWEFLPVVAQGQVVGVVREEDLI